MGETSYCRRRRIDLKMSFYDMSWVEHMFMKHIWSASAQGRKITYVMYVSAEVGGTKLTEVGGRDGRGSWPKRSR